MAGQDEVVSHTWQHRGQVTCALVKRDRRLSLAIDGRVVWKSWEVMPDTHTQLVADVLASALDHALGVLDGIRSYSNDAAEVFKAEWD